MKTLIKYDGKYEGFPGEARSWTLMSHFIDSNGCDRFRGSFGLQSLVDFGIVPVRFTPAKPTKKEIKIAVNNAMTAVLLMELKENKINEMLQKAA